MAKNVYKIILTGDVSGLKSALDKAGGHVDTSGSKFASFGKTAALGLAGATLAAGGAAVAFAKSSVDSFQTAAKETMKLQRLTGGTAEDMSRLRFAAQQTGIPVDKLAGGFAKLSKSLAGNTEQQEKHRQKLAHQNEGYLKQIQHLQQTGKGTDEAKAKIAELTSKIQANSAEMAGSQEAMTKWGIKWKDAQGNALPMKQVLGDVAAKFKDMPNGVEKNAMAMQLFGKSGADLIPLLNRGRDGLDELMKKSDQFGWTMGQGNVDAMKKSIASQRDFSAAWEGLKIQFGANIQPMLTALMTWLAEKLPQAIQWLKDRWKEWGPTIISVLQAVGSWFADVFGKIKGWIEDHKEQFKTIALRVMEVMTTVGGYIQGAWETIKTIFGVAVTFLQGVWDRFGADILERARNAWNAIQEVIGGAFDAIRGIFAFWQAVFSGDWGKAWEALKSIMKGVSDAMLGVWHMLLNGLVAVLQGAWNVLAGVWGWIWEGLKSLLSWAWEGIKSLVRSGIDNIVGFIMSLPGKIASVGGALWDAAQGIGSKIWHGIIDGLSGAASFVGDVAGKIWSGIKGFINDRFIGPVKRFSVDIPLIGKLTPFGGIPYLAQGGIVTRPTLAVLGEAGTEAVVPLSKAGQFGMGGGPMIGELHVHTGVGDPVAIGAEVISVIQKYERRNGTSWRTDGAA